MENKQLEIFFDKLTSIVNNKELIKLTLSNKKDKKSDLKNIIVTIVKLVKGYRLNFVYRHNTKDITKNYNLEEGILIIRDEFLKGFYNADIYSNNENINLISNPKGNIRINTSEPLMKPVTTFNHDRVKDRLIETNGNIYLRELGITNVNWEIRHEMTHKYKQINKYIELLAPNINELELSDNFHVADMGSGKGYLTFALYDYLTNTLSKKVKLTGVEFRDELVDSCNIIAGKAGFSDLKFVKGSIEKSKTDKIDILIALHACDTATDEAIYRGIKSNASLIVCAPCCHKQIRKELNVTNELSNIVKHGILKERQAEIITDTLRSMIMEAFGYRTKIFEFISTEHTPKNLMIVGRKAETTKESRELILSNIEAIKKIYGIKNHYLETLMFG